MSFTETILQKFALIRQSIDMLDVDTDATPVIERAVLMAAHSRLRGLAEDVKFFPALRDQLDELIADVECRLRRLR